jgi:hypothetical protein
MIETVQDSWGWSHMSHIRVYVPSKETFTKVEDRMIVEDSPGWLGMVSHVSHSVHATQRNTLLHKVGQDS